MTQKIKDLLHVIVLTIFAILCLGCFIGGTIYLIATCSGSLASVLASILGSLIGAGGTAVFGGGTVIGGKEGFYGYKNKKEK